MGTLAVYLVIEKSHYPDDDLGWTHDHDVLSAWQSREDAKREVERLTVALPRSEHEDDDYRTFHLRELNVR